MPGFKDLSLGERHVRLVCRVFLIALIVIFGIGSTSMRDVTYPQASEAVRPLATSVVMVTIDALSINDINDEIMPNLTRLTKMGAIGLMNGRTAKTQQPEHAYVTLGAGTRAQGPAEAGYAFNFDEPIEDARAFEVYIRNTSKPAPSEENVVHPYIATIIRANTNLSYEIVPGALGEALRRAGKRTAVFGNSDTLSNPCRYAVSIAMDRCGLVDMGNVGPSVTSAKPDFPGGVVANVARLSREVKNAVGPESSNVEKADLNVRKADLVVVESGDTARVERLWLSGTITEEAYSRARREALASADRLIAGILESVNLQDSILMVVVPTPSWEASKSGHLLTPVVIAGKGFSEGILTSQATRRTGLVTNTDVAATVLMSLGVAVPPWILGDPMTSVAELHPVQSVTGLLHRTAFVAGFRAPHLKTYVSILIIVVLGLPIIIAAATAMAARRKTNFGADTGANEKTAPTRKIGLGGKTAVRWKAAAGVEITLLALGVMPLVWLIMPLVIVVPFSISSSPTVFDSSALSVLYTLWAANMLNIIPPGLLTIMLAFVIAQIVRVGFGTVESRFAAMCLTTGTGIIVDAVAGAGLMKYSILGYDPIGGARFYGLGNEYMGALIGSLIVGCGLLLDCVSMHAQNQAHRHIQTHRHIQVYRHIQAGRQIHAGSRLQSGRRVLAWSILLIFASGVTGLALPTVGANLGGTLAAIVGFGVGYALFFRKRVAWSQVAGLSSFAALLILGIAAIDATQAGGPLSHWGKTLLWVRESGIQVLMDAVQRKTSMNLKLIRYTIWTKALLVFLGALAFIGIRPVGLARRILTVHPGFAGALSACLVAGGVSLITNDSGIVSSALITMYPALTLLALTWQEVM